MTMTSTISGTKIEHLLDRTEIFDLVRLERFCRDQRDWQGLVECYVPNAHIRTTWFDGTIEDFAEASRRKMQAGSQGKHWIFPAMLQMKDGRALIESPAFIFDRLTFDGVEFDLLQFCRFFSRAIKTSAGWRLATFEGIYQRDRMETVNPTDPLPVDWDLVKTLRPSYRFLAYAQIRRNYPVNPELLGDDRPDLLAAFYVQEKHWLQSGL